MWKSLCTYFALFPDASGSRLAFVPAPRIRSRSHEQGCVRMATNEPVDDQGYFAWLARKIERSQRPPVVKIRRPGMTRNFAVLLMRTSYQVCDDLDFVAMDDFQKQFFLLRQTEWAPYKEQCPGIKQGDLTDPDYFDFISFAQYASVAAAMRNGRDIFEERIGAEGEKQTVQRNPDFSDNGKLPEEHSRRVGDRILAYCTDTFGGTETGPAVAQGLSDADLLEGCNRVLNVLRLNFYMLDHSVEMDRDRQLLTVKATLPATVWGQQVLNKRGDQPINDFEAKAVGAYLRACGEERVSYSSRISGLDVTHIFKLYGPRQPATA